MLNKNYIIMDGRKLIDHIILLLERQDKRVYASNIVALLSKMTQYELETLINSIKK